MKLICPRLKLTASMTKARRCNLALFVSAGLMSLSVALVEAEEQSLKPSSLISSTVSGYVDSTYSTSVRTYWANQDSASAAQWITQIPSGRERDATAVLRAYELEWAAARSSLQAISLGEQEYPELRELLVAEVAQLTLRNDGSATETDRMRFGEPTASDLNALLPRERLGTLSSVPEPSSLVLAIGAASLLLLSRRCRRPC